MLEHDHTPAPGETEVEFSRRTFMKLAGFAFAGAIASGCQRAPVQNALSPLVQSEGVVPGRSLMYATTCGGCNAGCGVLAKAYDGRPIKLEGNPNHPVSLGGLCAVGQASILGLYDRLRLKHPTKNGEQATWASVDADISGQLAELRNQGKNVRFLSGTITSPTTRQAITSFLAGFPNSRHVVHDPMSCSAILDAHARTHGRRVLPQYHLDRAEVIVSFDADFLGTWIDPVAFAAGYKAGRYVQGPTPRLSFHVQVESRLSLTGSKADQRLCVGPGDFGLIMNQLAVRVARKANVNWGTEEAVASVPATTVDDLAERLWRAKGRCIVLCGSQDIGQQLVCNLLNLLLQNYGTTVDLERPSYQNQSNDHDMHELVDEIGRGQVGALIVYRSNPMYDLPDSPALKESLRNVPLVVSIASQLDETAAAAKFVCPEPHYLESWNDAEAVDGVVSLFQPVLEPLGEPRSLLETLAVWKGTPATAYDQLRTSWEANIYPRSLITVTFSEFWDQALHDGSVRVKNRQLEIPAFNQADVTPIRPAQPSPTGTLTSILYAKVGLRDGSQAYNPWLQELPDPITKMTWDNYACLSPATATRLDVRQGDVVNIEGAGEPLALPVVIQPGQHDDVVAIALGYGSKVSDRFAKIGPPWIEAGPTVGANGLVGVNAAPLLAWQNEVLRYQRDGVRLVKTGRQHPLACTQEEHPIQVTGPLAHGPRRQQLPIIRETTLPALLDVSRNGERPAEHERDLWPDDHENKDGPRWGMAIDLNDCTGCSACVVACQVENNIPVVGKDEVRRHREMHWLRIDRYYTSRETASNDVDVAFQPMLCQHCANAPCEVVCPVLATVHSDEGLNQQIYNRCVGTRYCANNCPYKVRRFNWFDYAHDDQLQNLVLNPDVTVRSRGVMEKCTLCVQRIQDGKIEAHRLGRVLADGDIQTACQQSCPTKAIVFGNLNDPTSRAAQLSKGARAYGVLAELNVKPAVSYLSLVRNRETT